MDVDNFIRSFQLVLNDWGIDHFKAPEFIKMRRLGRLAPPPDESLWANMHPTALMADSLRRHMNCPLIVGNGYRPKALNKQVGGHPRSQHLHFRALDLDLTPGFYDFAEKFYRYAVQMHMSEMGKDMKMGLGLYSPVGGTRIHIDFGHRHRYWGGLWGKYYRDIARSMR